MKWDFSNTEIAYLEFLYSYTYSMYLVPGCL